MAYHPQQFASYGQTGYGSFASFPQQNFGYPTTFAPQQHHLAPQQFAVADGSQHEGSQAGEVQSHSVSGFAAQPIDAGFGGFYGVPQGATYIQQGAQFGAPAAFPAYGQATVLPAAYGQSTFLPQHQLVHVAQPSIRRPGYNERLVAWRNRQKAFNRYKRATKEAIKSSNQGYYQQQQGTVLAHHQATVLSAPYGTAYGAAPIYGAQQSFGQTYIAGGFPQYAAYGQPTYLPQGAFVQQEQHEVQDGQYGDFSYSSAGANVQEVQADEPEIRGTQV